MNKHALVKKMAKDAGITEAAARKALKSFMEGVTDALKKHNGITLVGFGTFKKIYRKERNGRNPQTGEPIKIMEKNVVKFWAGKKLRGQIEAS
ncbi:MAG: HU family DNA-binding protein [Candidatus Moranbacteria bacterium]|nr:HU family DNA-binding protein [Candidatus Moranbacteria bacterium]